MQFVLGIIKALNGLLKVGLHPVPPLPAILKKLCNWNLYRETVKGEKNKQAKRETGELDKVKHPPTVYLRFSGDLWAGCAVVV